MYLPILDPIQNIQLMKNSISISLITMSLFFISCNGEQNQTENDGESIEAIKAKKELIELGKTLSGEVVWEGSILGMYSHYGSVDVKDINLKYEGEQIVGGNITIDMTTIDPLNDGFGTKEGQKRVDLLNHLNSADFFDVENFPEASFEITSVSEKGSTLIGNMTIKGKTQEGIVANIGESDGGLKAKLKLNRRDYGINFDHPAEDMVLSDDIALVVKLFDIE